MSRGMGDEVGSHASAPPRVLRWALGRLIPARDRTALLGEMDELYARRASRGGRIGALVWYTLELQSFAMRMPRARRPRGSMRPSDDGSLGRLIVMPLSAARSDVWLALRRLSARPGYAFSVIATLGIGVGGVTAVYAAADWVLLRPVPGVEEPEQMYWIHLVSEGEAPMPVSNPDLLDLTDRVPALGGIAASKRVDVHVTVPGDDAPSRLKGELVTASYFEVLRMRGVTGRTFDVAEHVGTPGPLEVVVSHELAARLWSDRETSLGELLGVNGHSFTVIGVTPPGFRGAELTGSALLWLPASAVAFVQPNLYGSNPERALSSRMPGFWTDLFGRAEVDAPPHLIATQLADAAQSIADAEAMSSFMFDTPRFVVSPGLGVRPQARPAVRRTLAILGGSAGFLLLLCLANVINLTLVRNASESAAVALRRALGASRLRITAHLLAENVVLGAGGAVVAAGAAFAGSAMLGSVPFGGPGASLDGMKLDATMLAGVLGAALAASLLAGLLPALTMARSTDTAAASIRTYGLDRSGGRLRAALVIAQVAVSTILLVGAGLLVQTVANLRNVDVGLDLDALAVVSLEPGLQGYDEVATERQAEELERRLLEEPGVVAVGSIHPAPFQGWGVNWPIRRTDASGDEALLEAIRFKASPGFFAAAGVDMVAGASFDAFAGGPADVVINVRMARSLFPNLPAAEVVGRDIPNGGFRRETLRIIGVVEDVRLVSVQASAAPIVFHRWAAGMQTGSLTTYIRVAGSPRTVLPAVRNAAGEVAREIPIFDLRTARAQIDELLRDQRTLARLAFALPALGALLAAQGLYGVLECAVAERTREIGIRVALGARPGRLLGAVVGQGMLLVAGGVTIGLAGTRIVNPILESRLFGVTPFEPAVFAIGVCALGVLSAAVSSVTALRAASVDPLKALRHH